MSELTIYNVETFKKLKQAQDKAKEEAKKTLKLHIFKTVEQQLKSFNFLNAEMDKQVAELEEKRQKLEDKRELLYSKQNDALEVLKSLTKRNSINKVYTEEVKFENITNKTYYYTNDYDRKFFFNDKHLENENIITLLDVLINLQNEIEEFDRKNKNIYSEINRNDVIRVIIKKDKKLMKLINKVGKEFNEDKTLRSVLWLDNYYYNNYNDDDDAQRFIRKLFDFHEAYIREQKENEQA